MKYVVTLSVIASLFSVAFGAADITGTSMDIKQTGFLRLTDCVASTDNAMELVVPINTCIHDSTSQRGGKAIMYTNVAVITGNGGTNAQADTVQYKIATYYSSDCSDAAPLAKSSFMYATRTTPSATDYTSPNCGAQIQYDSGREMADKFYDSSDQDYAASYAVGTYATGYSVFNGAASASLYSTNEHFGEYMASINSNHFDTMDVDGLVNKYYSNADCTTLVGGMWYREKHTCHKKLLPNVADMTTSFHVINMGEITKYSDTTCGSNITDAATYATTQPIGMARVDYTISSGNEGATACAVVPQSQWVSGLPVMGSYYITAGFVAAATDAPTSMPTFTAESYGQTTWDVKKRHRVGGLCENGCSGHGSCVVNQNCLCYTGMDGEPEWTGPDCSLRTCPRDYAWVGDVVNANDLHPWAECSNRGSCDRKTGVCSCYPGYDGVACQRFSCPNNCNERGTCWPEKHLAVKASRVYDSPWDAMKAVGCLCDAGYRGPSCEFQECPSGADPLDGYGNEAGRDCSGRGLCDYGSGTCNCFSGFYGTRCQYQTTLM